MIRRDRPSSAGYSQAMSRQEPASHDHEQDRPAGRGKAATDQQLEFALRAGRMGSWELDIAAARFTTSEYCRVVFGLRPDDPFETVHGLVALVHPDDRKKRQDAIDRAIATATEMEA